MYTSINLPSALGLIRIDANPQALVGIYFVGQRWEPAPIEDASHTSTAITDLATQQLQEYFAGSRLEFTLPLAPKGTDFQQAVWQQISTIEAGQLLSYGNIATRLGNPNASRAVGAATGKNPLSIVVPCHRVVGSSGRLTGYAGGLKRKITLLQLEKALPPDPQCTFEI